MFGLPPCESREQTRADSTTAPGTDAARAPAEVRHRVEDQATTPRGRLQHLRTAPIAIARAHNSTNVPTHIWAGHSSIRRRSFIRIGDTSAFGGMRWPWLPPIEVPGDRQQLEQESDGRMWAPIHRSGDGQPWARNAANASPQWPGSCLRRSYTSCMVGRAPRRQPRRGASDANPFVCHGRRELIAADCRLCSRPGDGRLSLPRAKGAKRWTFRCQMY